MVRLMNKYSFLLLLVFVTSCKTKKQYYINSDSFSSKKVYFSLKEGSSYQKVKKIGEHIGNSRDPNIYDVFRKSVEELSEEINIDLFYSPKYIFPNDSVISVMADIKNIDWVFINGTKAVMNVNIDYMLPDQNISIIGTNEYKVFLAGTKSGNLKNSLKDGHKQILSTLWE
ncbi:hypothetical protein LBV24_09715 [Winogradskyella sp. 2Y89]|uniref:DUF4823 domain-containing protein n=1 Tax=Winogradskyella vincentii TaxID=2877122 RepID=A0ABS7Y0N6_9FLAO|nr:hypothetical protein [Winogradskyella vincentii]